MSTKNLARTIIEGGRRSVSKDARHDSNVKNRRAINQFCHTLGNDPESWDDADIPLRRKYYKEFDDKLGPVYKWLDSKVGQRWDDVHSLICSTFDTRTIAGQHIVYDHLIRSVQTSLPVDRYNYYKWFVDENGDLRAANRTKRSRYGKPVYSMSELRAWTGFRKVIDHGNAQFWTAEPTRIGWAACRHGNFDCPYDRKSYLKGDKDVGRGVYRVYECYQPLGYSWAQGSEFNAIEYQIWSYTTESQKAMFRHPEKALGKKRK